MKAHELAELLGSKPFCPVVIQMQDGQSYEIRRPGMAIVTPNMIAIGIARANGSRLAERIIRYPITEIVRVEPMEVST